MDPTTHLLFQGAAGNAGGWDLSTAIYNGSPINFFYVGVQELTPEGLFFKDDGTKLYVTGSSSDSIFEYNLSTAWNISTASFNQSFSVSAKETAPTGVFFKTDGTKMYVIGENSDSVHEYNLSTAWNISTASFNQTFSVATQDAQPKDLFFKPDGTKLFVVGAVNDRVFEYNLSTAWNISTASFNQSFSVATQETNPEGLFFKDDGTKMYVIGTSSDSINEYNLSTAWNISTASFNQSFSVATQDTNSQGLFFKPDGTEVYLVGDATDSIYSYQLSTPWNVSTASFTAPLNDYFSFALKETLATGVVFKDDGTKMYVIGQSSDSVHEYNLSTTWSISTASFNQSFSVSAKETAPTGVVFKTDGTKMYVIGDNSNSVHEYNLSTAWNISTASFNQTFSVATQDTSPQGLFFKDDGTKMYVMGFITDSIYEYNLSTAWNISTASFNQSFSVSAQDSLPSGLFFKPDGTKVYILGQVTSNTYEYNLSTAWNISTASFVQSFSVSGQEALPRNLFFTPDGIKMYIIGTQRDAVWSYDL